MYWSLTKLCPCQEYTFNQGFSPNPDIVTWVLVNLGRALAAQTTQVWLPILTRMKPISNNKEERFSLHGHIRKRRPSSCQGFVCRCWIFSDLAAPVRDLFRNKCNTKLSPSSIDSSLRILHAQGQQSLLSWTWWQLLGLSGLTGARERTARYLLDGWFWNRKYFKHKEMKHLWVTQISPMRILEPTFSSLRSFTKPANAERKPNDSKWQ